MRKLYLHPEMKFTIFHSVPVINFFNQKGVVFTQSADEAEVLVGNQYYMLQAMVAEHKGKDKQFLLWTHEPAFWQDSRTQIVLEGETIQIMSLYSGDIYSDNYFYAPLVKQIEISDSKNTLIRMKKIAMLAIYNRHIPLITKQCIDRDLMPLRSQLALLGHDRGIVDIYGNGWPQGITKGESRSGDWVTAKYEILLAYGFNLCFENILWPYYCTEKIWQSIQAGCLPIYYGQPTMYEDFPKDSFIDYALINDPEKLFDLVETMTKEEYHERFEKCWETMLRCIPHGYEGRFKAAERVIERISQR